MSVGTYALIASTTASSTPQVITFNNIPSTYTDLVIVVNAGYTNSVGDDQFTLRFNSDSGANYSDTHLYGSGSAAGSYRQTGNTWMFFNRISRNDLASSVIIHVQDYANTTTNKTTISRSGTADGSFAGTNSAIDASVGLWRSTSAITRIDLSNYYNTNYFRNGSTFRLYGIEARNQ